MEDISGWYVKKISRKFASTFFGETDTNRRSHFKKITKNGKQGNAGVIFSRGILENVSSKKFRINFRHISEKFAENWRILDKFLRNFEIFQNFIKMSNKI